MIFLYVLLAIAILLLMVLIHELGHYIAGRILKFKITEFSVGFGKALFSRTNKRGEKISLRIIPLGGYCAFYGEEDEVNSPDAFNNQKPWKRLIVFFAGVFFNFLTAIIFSFILLVSYGADIVKVVNIDENSPNYSTVEDVSKLMIGDVIYKVNGENLDACFGRSFNQIISDNAKLENKLTFTVKRNGEFIDIANIAYYEVTKEDKIYLAIGVSLSNQPYSFLEALAKCVPYAFGLAWQVLKALWMLITFQVPISQIGGPITTISTIAEMAQNNAFSLLYLIPFLSANLAVFNLLPFPALDGSHMLFTSIEWIRRKPINRKIENYIHFGGLCVLFTFVIIVDILHFVL